jgi:hypothetical protein
MAERGSRNGASLSEELSTEGFLERAPLLGTPKEVLSKALAWASVSIWAPIQGNMEGRCFHRALKIERYVNVFLQRGPLGTLKSFCMPGLFRQQRIVYLGSFLAPRGH